MIAFARPVPEMIDGVPKRPPGARSDTFTTRRLPLVRATQASRPEPSEPMARLGTNATSSVATVRGVPSDGPTADPNATDSRTRRPVASRLVRSSAAMDRCAYGTTREVAAGSVRSGPKAEAPGRNDAPRAPAGALAPIPSWKPQVRTAVPLPARAASSGEMNVCGAETVAGGVHVAAAAGAAATSEAAAATAARAGNGRMRRERAEGAEGCGERNSGGPSMRGPPLAGLKPRHVGRRRSSFDRRRLAGGEPPTSRPDALVGGQVVLGPAKPVNFNRSRRRRPTSPVCAGQTRRCGYSAATSSR